jgi:EAL domain-containing protein (putative c-di-GMP-specific phosphodiesterase class I)
MGIYWVRERYAAGQSVFREGDWGEDAYLIEMGKVDITVSRNGEEVTVATLHEGEMFGEIALVDRLPRTASVVVVEDCTLIPITRELVVAKMKQSDPLLSHLLGVVVSRYRETREGNPTRAKTKSDESSLRLRDYAINQLKIAQYLSDALVRDEFQLYFQPIVHLINGRLAGFEALIRWNQPDMGLVSPLGFIGVAEDTGLIVPIGRWVLKQAIATMATLQTAMDQRDPDNNGLFMSVNLSAKQLQEPGEVDVLIGIIRDSGADPRRIKLEVTESALIDNPELVKMYLTKLKDLGVMLAIDDFGTGYSSLSYLEQYPLDTLKIDQSFIATMRARTSSQRITRAIASLANDLEMSCIAEGIEDEADIKPLLQMRCQYGQGYHFAKPMGEAQALDYIRRRG